MNIQYSFPCFPFFIFVIVLITTSFPVTFCQKDVTLFRNCSSSFSCGESFPEIRYPYWGGNRSSECGEAGLNVTCVEDNHLTIDISGHTYRVLHINGTSYSITIASNGLLNGGCLESYRDTPIPIHPFIPVGGETIDILLYYNCLNDDQNENPRTRFGCTNIGERNATVYYFSNDTDCGSRIIVPALKTKVDEFERKDASVNLWDLVETGFNVEYPVNWTACVGCLLSKGVCWPGINLPEPTCLCSNGSRDSLFCKDVGGGSNTTILLGVALGTFTMCSFAFILIVCFRYRGGTSMVLFFKRKTKEDRKLEAMITQYGTSLAPQRYSYSYIKKMTVSLSEKLGQGGYGTVYRGWLSNGQIVAVKILKVAKQNSEEFINEVMSTSRTSHVNVVRLLGFCMEGKRRALVYEYMSNGSLEKYIHCKKNEVRFNQLEMDKLYKISLGVARGLEYLHRGCNTRIMHFDIKPHNILLDEHFHPKISDFGMAKQCKMNESMVSIMGARGTIGYIAPELVSRAFGAVSYKSDVYSYGMMILEIVGRRKNVSFETSHASEVYFPHWAYQHLVIDNDLRLKDVTPEEDEIARKIILVGLWCVQNDPSLRPTMSKAIEMLERELWAIPMPPKSFFDFPSTPPLQTSSTNSTKYHSCVVEPYFNF